MINYIPPVPDLVSHSRQIGTGSARKPSHDQKLIVSRVLGESNSLSWRKVNVQTTIIHAQGGKLLQIISISHENPFVHKYKSIQHRLDINAFTCGG